MSVGLYRYNGDIEDRNCELTLSENIATQEFYDEYWEAAIHELGIALIRDGSKIYFHQLEAAEVELKRLREWAKQHLNGSELDYITSRIENVQDILPSAFISASKILYIF
ncbi:hypothetical protein MHI48_30120 [Paenibacillus sp. FSL H7-0942]|uniref:hypothetical protein n=1 Tax=Paenibacillus TaxID=44249 RepID=UPI00096E626A|nr:hypothetical protein [Paenibacillus amylolyticus]OMF02798.1 hypothetical protein BK129_24230 [Paenibacillus amylolyticus]